MDVSMHGQETPDNVTLVSESGYDDYDPHYTSARKRRRVEPDPMTQQDREFRLWSEELLDYFILRDDPDDSLPAPPIPPAHADLNRPIDEKGYTAIHWAAAMGDIEVMKDLIRRGAAIDIPAKNGETPLMRAVIFTNSFDRQNMEKLAGLLVRTTNMQEWSGSTVFHHIAATTSRRSKYACARYYMDSILNKMIEVLAPHEIESVLNFPDHNGDTAITIAARHGARKCVRSLIGRNAAVDIPNNAGETADQLIVQLNSRRQQRENPTNRQLSSSPFQPDGLHGAARGGAVQPHISTNGIPFDPLLPHSSLNGTTSGLNGSDVYTSESALKITAQDGPLVIDGLRKIAVTCEEQKLEKDTEHEEAVRVVSIRSAELAAAKKQQEELLAKEIEQTRGGLDTDEHLCIELSELEAECQSLLTQEESLTFRRIHNATAAAPSEDDNNLKLRHHVTRDLIALQQDRHHIVKNLTQYLATLSTGDNQQYYRTLIAGALGVTQSDVEALLPDILSELEEARGLESVGA